MSNTPEGKVKAKVREIFKKHKVPYVHISGSMYASPGAEDYNATVNGFTLAVECKAGDGKQTEPQKRRQEALEAAGGTYIVVNENSLRELDLWITILSRRTWRHPPA